MDVDTAGWRQWFVDTAVDAMTRRVVPGARQIAIFALALALTPQSSVLVVLKVTSCLLLSVSLLE